jgi:hypothetical protein
MDLSSTHDFPPNNPDGLNKRIRTKITKEMSDFIDAGRKIAPILSAMPMIRPPK